MKKVAILTVSDGVVAGVRPDRSGDVLEEKMRRLGYEVVRREVVPDERDHIVRRLRAWVQAGEVDLILTTGGTGLGPRDVTPEAVSEVVERVLPGYGELLRSDGLRHTPMAVLSRSLAGTARSTLVIALPGSPKAVEQGIDALAATLTHALDLISGKTDHPSGA